MCKIIDLICGKKLPIWAYGLECTICEMSFGDPEFHLEHAQELGTVKKHEGLIPKLLED